MKSLRTLAVIAALSTSLAACSTISLFGGDNPATGLGATTVADLQVADKIALAEMPPDAFQDQCYKALIGFVQAQQAQDAAYAGLTVNGVFSALAAVQAGQAQTMNVLSPATVAPIELGCGPLLIRLQNTPAAFLASLAAIGVK
jgi:predicted small secreted protein